MVLINLHASLYLRHNLCSIDFKVIVHVYIDILHIFHACQQQVLKKIGRYIQEQNNTIYIPRGLLLVDPIERGLRVVSFVDSARVVV